MMPVSDKTLLSIKHRLHSFRCALRGLFILFSNEPNAKIHLVTGFSVLLFGLIINLTIVEWLFVASAIGFVLFAEGVNTSIEFVCDFVSPERQKIIRNIKDIAAACVLIAVITAVTIGGIIFIPKILNIVL